MAYFNGTTWVSSTPSQKSGNATVTAGIGKGTNTPVINTTYKNNTGGTTTYTTKSNNSAYYGQLAGEKMANALTNMQKNWKVNEQDDDDDDVVTPKVVDDDTSSGYDYTGLIEALQKISQEKYSALEDALLRNKQSQDDSANASYLRNLRQWKKTYGNGMNGQGLSNKFNIAYNRDNQLQDNQTNYLNNLATIKSNKYDDYSGLASNLSGLDSNSLKKILSLI